MKKKTLLDVPGDKIKSLEDTVDKVNKRLYATEKLLVELIEDIRMDQSEHFATLSASMANKFISKLDDFHCYGYFRGDFDY